MIKVFNFDIDFAYSMGIPLESILGPNGVVYWQAEHDVTVTGIPPLLLSKSVGKPLVDWSITGNTVQNGTPTPEQPVEVKGVGDKNIETFDIATIYNGWISGDINRKLYKETSTVTITYIKCYYVEKDKAYTIYQDYETLKNTTDRSSAIVNDSDIVLNAFKLSMQKEITFTAQANGWLCFGTDANATNVRILDGYKVPVISKGKNLAYSSWAEDFVKNHVTTGNAIVRTEYGRRVLWREEGATGPMIEGVFKENTQYTLSMDIMKQAPYDRPNIRFRYTDNTTQLLYTPSDSKQNEFVHLVQTSQPNKTLLRLEANWNYGIDRYDLDTVMLEEGTTATEYEPYREPITTPLYVNSPLMSGERLTPQGRDTKWKELVLTGNETWAKDNSTPNSYGINNFRIDLVDKPNTSFETSKSTHFTFNGNAFNVTKNVSFRIYVSAGGVGSVYLRLLDSDFKTIDAVKVWLKSEYDAGHPVTVWYQLETPSTEPVSFPEIPTFSGDTYIDTDTEVKPSAMSVTYKSK